MHKSTKTMNIIKQISESKFKNKFFATIKPDHGSSI